MATSTPRSRSVGRPSSCALGAVIGLAVFGTLVPIILSLSGAVGGILLTVRLVAHKRAAEATQG